MKRSIGNVECPMVKIAPSGQCAACGGGCLLMCALVSRPAQDAWQRRVFEECGGWREEEVAGHGTAEIQQPVVIAGWPADEHVHEHLLNRSRRTGVGDEISAELTMPAAAEGHIVPQYLDLLPVLHDRGQCVVGGAQTVPGQAPPETTTHALRPEVLAQADVQPVERSVLSLMARPFQVLRT